MEGAQQATVTRKVMVKNCDRGPASYLGSLLLEADLKTEQCTGQEQKTLGDGRV